MLEELATVLNERLGLEGKELEAACLMVGAALAESIPVMRNHGTMSEGNLENYELYQIANHFSNRLHKIRCDKLGLNPQGKTLYEKLKEDIK